MSKAAEELFLKHDRDRREAHEAAQRIADRLIMQLHGIKNAKSFATVDCDDLVRLAQDIAVKQGDYLEADHAVRRSASEALG